MSELSRVVCPNCNKISYMEQDLKIFHCVHCSSILFKTKGRWADSYDSVK